MANSRTRQMVGGLVATIVMLLSSFPAVRAAANPTLPSTPWKVFFSTHPTPVFYRGYGIATGGRGNIFVADSGDHRIKKFSPTGALLSVWGTDTPGATYLAGPWGVAVDPAGNVYAVDRGVVKFSSSGKVLARYTQGPLASVSSLAIDKLGYVYAAALHRPTSSGLSNGFDIEKLSPSGQVVAMRSFKYPNPLLDAPLAVALTLNADSSVVLSIKGQVHCHSCDGTYYKVETLSPQGDVDLSWKAPAGGNTIAVDTAGDIYLAGPGTVQQFDSSGTLQNSWGQPGCGIDHFGPDPKLTIGPGGNIYVSDVNSDSNYLNNPLAPPLAGVIHVLSTTGTTLAMIGQCPGQGKRYFGQLSGLTVTPDGSVYAADEVSSNVIHITPDGKSATVAFQQTSHPGFIESDSQGNLYEENVPDQTLYRLSPTGQVLGKMIASYFTDVAVDARGNVYGLNSDGSIEVYPPISSPSGSTQNWIRHWYMRGYAPHQGGQDPMAIALDSQNNVYATDTRYSHIQKFSSTGKLLAVWGKRGSGKGQFIAPTGIAVDKHGDIYVLDTGNARVARLNSKGQVTAMWGRGGQGAGQFMGPARLTVDGNGDVFVADTTNDRIQELPAAK